jgi:hypothetical protein
MGIDWGELTRRTNQCQGELLRTGRGSSAASVPPSRLGAPWCRLRCWPGGCWCARTSFLPGGRRPGVRTRDSPGLLGTRSSDLSARSKRRASATSSIRVGAFCPCRKARSSKKTLSRIHGRTDGRQDDVAVFPHSPCGMSPRGAPRRRPAGTRRVWRATQRRIDPTGKIRPVSPGFPRQHGACTAGRRPAVYPSWPFPSSSSRPEGRGRPEGRQRYRGTAEARGNGRADTEKRKRLVGGAAHFPPGRPPDGLPLATGAGLTGLPPSRLHP